MGRLNLMKGSGHGMGGGMRSEGVGSGFGGFGMSMALNSNCNLSMASVSISGSGSISGSQQTANFMHATRASKRLYVGNLPHNVSEEEIRKFFNATMIAAKPEADGSGGVVGGEQSVTNVYLNAQKRFAFVEFRSPQEATQAMELEGIQFFGESLKIGRPANYNPNLLPQELRPDNVPKLNTSKLGIVSNFVPNGPNKLYCGGIPYSLTEDQVKELLSTYGQLRAFFLAKDQSTGLSKGYCFFQFEDASVTESAIAGLNGIKIGDRQLAVRRHTPSSSMAITMNNGIPTADGSGSGSGSSSGSAMAMGMGMPMTAMTSYGAMAGGHGIGGAFNTYGPTLSAEGGGGGTGSATNVLMLQQMVTIEELQDDEEYTEIVEDVRDECTKYGTVKSITIPRPKTNTNINADDNANANT